MINELSARRARKRGIGWGSGRENGFLMVKLVNSGHARMMKVGVGVEKWACLLSILAQSAQVRSGRTEFVLFETSAKVKDGVAGCANTTASIFSSYKVLNEFVAGWTNHNLFLWLPFHVLVCVGRR